MLAPVVRWVKSHPKTVYTVYLGVCALLLVEVFLRISIRYDPSYYTAYANPRPGIVQTYPYGIIKFNQDGYPDDEFDPVKSRPRVAYIGDSNTFGVGAGHGYRVTELLERHFPQIEHMNMSFGIGGELVNEHKILSAAQRYDLDLVVYLLTLNDIQPTRRSSAPVQYEEKRVFRLRHYFDWLRGRSYLYTAVRTAVKNYYAQRGYDYGGQRSYELFPQQFGDVYQDTAERIDHVATQLNANGVGFVVMLLPYEMQVSRDAEEGYQRRHHVEWDGAFIDRGPQRQLLERIRVPRVVDLYDAFVHEAHGRDLCKLGECFVYDKGDKLDWHHPNRRGHQLIADFLARRENVEPLFSTLAGGTSPSPTP